MTTKKLDAQQKKDADLKELRLDLEAIWQLTFDARVHLESASDDAPERVEAAIAILDAITTLAHRNKP